MLPRRWERQAPRGRGRHGPTAGQVRRPDARRRDRRVDSRGFSTIYPVLRALEDSGRIRRGTSWRVWPPRIRAPDGRGHASRAADAGGPGGGGRTGLDGPANPYGHMLRWPVTADPATGCCRRSPERSAQWWPSSTAASRHSGGRATGRRHLPADDEPDRSRTARVWRRRWRRSRPRRRPHGGPSHRHDQWPRANRHAMGRFSWKPASCSRRWLSCGARQGMGHGLGLGRLTRVEGIMLKEFKEFAARGSVMDLRSASSLRRLREDHQLHGQRHPDAAWPALGKVDFSNCSSCWGRDLRHETPTRRRPEWRRSTTGCSQHRDRVPDRGVRDLPDGEAAQPLQNRRPAAAQHSEDCPFCASGNRRGGTRCPQCTSQLYGSGREASTSNQRPETREPRPNLRGSAQTRACGAGSAR